MVLHKFLHGTCVKRTWTYVLVVALALTISASSVTAAPSPSISLSEKPVAGNSLVLRGSGCDVKPCRWTWVRAKPSRAVLGHSKAQRITFTQPGWKRLRLLVRNANGARRAAERRVLVRAGPPLTPTPPSAGCDTDQGQDPTVAILRCDDGTGNPEDLWGNIECAADSRVTTQDGYRTITVLDGDDFYGERCELGRNDHRYGLASPGDHSGTFMLYKEGEHKITSYDMCLSPTFPVSGGSWQVVMQMKQTQPHPDAGSTPIIALEVRSGHWLVANHGNDKWVGPVATPGACVHISFDVVYSVDASTGRLQATIAGTTSPLFTMQTLVPATVTDSGIPAGSGIPGHLRLGIYHDTARPGSSLNVDNVRVARPL